MKSRLCKVLKNDSGSIAIEAVIGTLMILACLVVIMDLLVITWKSNLTAQVSTKVARQVGIQGGYRLKAPNGFPGGENAYTNPRELGAMITEQFRAMGIADGNWEMIITGEDGRQYVYNATSTPVTGEYDYQQIIKVEVRLRYQWEMSQMMLPMLRGRTYTLTSKRTTISEWKYDYDNWANE